MTQRAAATMMSLLVLLFLFCGFLSWQFTNLKSRYDNIAAERQDQEFNVANLNQEVLRFKKELAKYRDDFKELANSVSTVSTTLPKNLRQEFQEEFLKNPSFAINTPSFRQTLKENGMIEVIGYKDQIKKWIEENELFLDHVVRKSLTLDWDARLKKVVVTDIIADSVFNQLGLQKGDVILTIDGQSFTRGDDIRDVLMKVTPKKIRVQRAGQFITYDVAYQDHDAAQVN